MTAPTLPTDPPPRCPACFDLGRVWSETPAGVLHEASCEDCAPMRRAEAAGLDRVDLGGGCIEWRTGDGATAVVHGATFWWWRSPTAGAVKADDEPMALAAWCAAHGVPR